LTEGLAGVHAEVLHYDGPIRCPSLPVTKKTQKFVFVYVIVVCNCLLLFAFVVGVVIDDEVAEDVVIVLFAVVNESAKEFF
jgi:hypothetical protein